MAESTQVDGTPIRKSISGPLADIYMIWFEEQYVFSDNNMFKPHINSGKDAEMTCTLFGMEDLTHLIVFLAV